MSGNRLRIIGSGNAFNTDGRSHACYLLEDSLLLDCGASSLQSLNALKVDLSRLEGILLTHFHGDHYAGLPFLLLTFEYILKRSRKITILGPAGVETAVRSILDATYAGMTFSFPMEFRSLEPHKPASYLEFSILPFPITHRNESLGYRITRGKNTFAFSGDTAYDENLFQLVDGVDLAVVELSLFENDGSVAHVALSQVRDRRLTPRRLVFSHIYDELEVAARAEGFETGRDGMQLEY